MGSTDGADRKQAEKGCAAMASNTGWNDDRLDNTSMLSAISPVDPLEDREPGLNAQDHAAIERLPEGSALLIVRKGPNLGARFPDSEIFLDDVTVSRKHAAFMRQGNDFVVRDLGSLNGTYVDRERVDEAVLQAGQTVQIGKYRLSYHPFTPEGD